MRPLPIGLLRSSALSLIAAPAASIAFSGKQYSGNTGVADLGNVTLTGDWTLGLVTRIPVLESADYTAGVILSIGSTSATALTDASTLSLVYSGQYNSAWDSHTFGGGVSLVAVDDAGHKIAGRRTNDALYGDGGAQPLVSWFLADNTVHGFFVTCSSGIAQFWHVDPSGAAVAMDTSFDVQQAFAGITNKPLRIGGSRLSSVPAGNGGSANWSERVQAIVVKHGAAATGLQMSRIVMGADARAVLSLAAGANDRYWPGSISGSSVTELVAGANGTITGTGVTAGATLLASTYADFVTLDQDARPSILPRAYGASTTVLRVWGQRGGPATSVQLRIVNNSSGAVVDDWQTVATISANAAWSGSFTATAAHAAPKVAYDWQERHVVAGGGYSTPLRMGKPFSLGLVIAQAGQSILQKFYDDGGSAVTMPAAARFYAGQSNSSDYNGLTAQNNLVGWADADGFTNYGASTMLANLSSKVSAGVGLFNGAIGGQSITAFVPATKPAFQRLASFIRRNRPQSIVWGNGQADTGMSEATRFTALDAFLTQIDAVVSAAPGGVWSYDFLIFPINGDANGADPGPIRDLDIRWTASRNAARPSGVANCRSVGILTYLLDGQTTDGTHLTADGHGSGMLAERYAQTLAFLAGAVTGPGYGPTWDAASSTFTSASGSTVVAMRLAARSDVTGLATGSGGAVSGGEVSFNSGGSYVTATGAIASATTVNFTVSGTPSGNTVLFRYLSGRPTLSVANALYDTRGTTIGLNASNAALPGFPVPPIQTAVTITGTGGGGGGGSTPSVSSTNFVATNGFQTSRTMTLPQTPAAGAKVLLIVTNWPGYTVPSAPSGFTLVTSQTGSTAGDQWFFVGPATALVSNGVTYASTGTPGDTGGSYLVEVNAPTAVSAVSMSVSTNNSPDFSVTIADTAGSSKVLIGVGQSYTGSNSGPFTCISGGTLLAQLPGENFYISGWSLLFAQSAGGPVVLHSTAGINIGEFRGSAVVLT